MERLGVDNLRAIGETVTRYGIDCRWEETGELLVATAEHEVEELASMAGTMQVAGHDIRLLDATETRAEVASPTYLGALADPRGTALVEVARLAWGLRGACRGLGVRIYEGTRATGLEREGAAMAVVTGHGRVRAARVVLATNAFPSLLRRCGSRRCRSTTTS